MLKCQEMEQFTGTAAAPDAFAMPVSTRKVQYFIFWEAELDPFGKESVCLAGVG